MNPHWINTCDRLPDDDKEVYVLVVHRRSSDIEYARAKRSEARWVFTTKSPYSKVVAWLESDNLSLSDNELSRVPKDEIRY